MSHIKWKYSWKKAVAKVKNQLRSTARYAHTAMYVNQEILTARIWMRYSVPPCPPLYFMQFCECHGIPPHSPPFLKSFAVPSLAAPSSTAASSPRYIRICSFLTWVTNTFSILTIQNNWIWYVMRRFLSPWAKSSLVTDVRHLNKLEPSPYNKNVINIHVGIRQISLMWE